MKKIVNFKSIEDFKKFSINGAKVKGGGGCGTTTGGTMWTATPSGGRVDTEDPDWDDEGCCDDPIA